MSFFLLGSSPAATAEQHAFRVYNDDGSESAMTAAAAQNAGYVGPATTRKTVRFLLQTTGALGAKTFKLVQRKVGGGNYGVGT